MEIMNVRKLVALDIYLHGYTFILLEFALGVAFAFILGAYTLFTGISLLLGTYIIMLGINYLPLLAYSIDIKMKNSAEKEGKPVMKMVKNYSIQQFLLFVPLIVPLLAITQSIRKT
jgi:hypothetical protein